MANSNQKPLLGQLFKLLPIVVLLMLSLATIVVAAPLKTPALLYIDPGNKTLNVNDSPFTFYLRIQDVSDFGAYSTRLTYNPALVDVAVVVLTDFMESTGREANILYETGSGYVNFGAYTTGNVLGASGNGDLAQITVMPKTPGVTTLNLNNTMVTNHLGDTIIHTASNGQLTITAANLYGDCNADRTVNEADIATLIEVIFQHITGNPGCDANQDNQVDAADITCTALIYFNGADTCQ